MTGIILRYFQIRNSIEIHGASGCQMQTEQVFVMVRCPSAVSQRMMCVFRGVPKVEGSQAPVTKI